ncbi:hypothetical protein ACGFX8_36640 [Streptomyces sp. NPDC048362]|uniref:hypothetical protein n=1 Tax=Streptomyces sp. NPDC048362 TaxID=3365539 RepID=UPI003711C1C4
MPSTPLPSSPPRPAAVVTALERIRRRPSDVEHAEYDQLVAEYEAAVRGAMATAA